MIKIYFLLVLNKNAHIKVEGICIWINPMKITNVSNYTLSWDKKGEVRIWKEGLIKLPHFLIFCNSCFMRHGMTAK